jgi:hypothetical protein
MESILAILLWGHDRSDYNVVNPILGEEKIMRKPVHWKVRTKTSMFGPPLRYYASWYVCNGCGFKFLKQKHEEKVCDLCNSQSTFSHLLMLNTKTTG